MSSDMSFQVSGLKAEENERAFLTCCISEPSIAKEYYQQLDHKMFWDERHRYLWRAIERCIEDGGDPDYFGILAKLEDVGAENAISRQFLDCFVDDFVRHRNVAKYVDVILERYRRKQITQRCKFVASQVERGEMTYDEAKREIGDHLRDQTDDEDEGRSIASVSQEVVQDMEDRQNGDAEPSFDCGVDPVDDVLDVNLSRYVLVAARPKHGKTSLAVAMLLGLVRNHGFSADIWYADGQDKDIGVAMLSHLSGVENTIIKDPPEDGSKYQEQYRKVMQAHGELADLDINVHQSGNPDVHDIEIKARARAQECDRYVCMVDYLQKCDAGYSGESGERLNTEAASAMLCRLRTDYNCVALGLAQFNRSAEREKGIPKYHQLRAAGRLEEDVNHLLVWHRPHMDKSDATAQQKRMGILHHQLSKHSQTAAAKVEARLGTSKFYRYNAASAARDYDER